MSYDIMLTDPVTKEIIQVSTPHFMQGGTYAMYGTTELHYWAATEGNAKRALCQLLALAQMRSDGIWDGD